MAILFSRSRGHGQYEVKSLKCETFRPHVSVNTPDMKLKVCM